MTNFQKAMKLKTRGLGFALFPCILPSFSSHNAETVRNVMFNSVLNLLVRKTNYLVKYFFSESF